MYLDPIYAIFVSRGQRSKFKATGKNPFFRLKVEQWNWERQFRQRGGKQTGILLAP